MAWLVTAVVVGFVGWSLFALSEASPDRALGVALLVATVLAAGLGLVLLVRSAGVRRWSPALSGALVVLGVVAAAVLLRGDGTFLSDVLLVGAPPVVGGVLTALLAARRRA